MRPVVLSLIIAVGAISTAQAQGLDGKEIVLEPASHLIENSPVFVPYEGESVDGRVIVSDKSTGKRFLGTVYGGHLVFVPDGAPANTEKKYVVRVSDDARPPVVRIEKGEKESTLDVYIEDELFTTYHYSNEYKKPFLWPVNAEGGVGVTRDWPMGERDKSADHPHHKSLWTAYGDVNGADCWAEGGNSGFQHSGEVTWESGDAVGWIHAENVWQDSEHNPVITEERTYRFYNTPAKGRLMDVTVTFKADYGEVLFGDTKEGGLVSLRMADVLRERGGTGTITNSAGGVGAGETWGKPAAWCDYSGTIEGVGKRGVAVFDHPSNLRHPTHWHVRDYGLMGANCFGYSYFTDGERNGDFVLEADDSTMFNYRVYVHSGDVEESNVADHYSDFAAPRKANWAE